MFIAEVTFWGQDKGGRFSPPQSGFKPQIKAGDAHTSCYVTSMDGMVTTFEFDKPTTVKLDLMFPDQYGDRLSINSKVLLYEGDKQVAEGRIIAVEK